MKAVAALSETIQSLLNEAPYNENWVSVQAGCASAKRAQGSNTWDYLYYERAWMLHKPHRKSKGLQDEKLYISSTLYCYNGKIISLIM